MVQFRCQCGKMLQASDANAGRDAQCPVCGALTPIPSFSDAPLRPEMAEPPPRRHEDDRLRDEPRRPWREDDRHPEPPKKSSGALVVILVVVGVLGVAGLCGVGLLLPAVQKVRTAASRMQEANNLKMMGLAVHNFASDHGGGTMPCGVAYRGQDGKPLLSWRVAFLQYYGPDEAALFRQFKLDEPWDGPNNSRLLPLIPKVYQRPGDAPGPDGLTHYLAVSGRGMVFDERHPRCRTVPGSTLRLGMRFVDVTDGMSNTVFIVTAAKGVPWTKPEDFDVDDGPIAPRLDMRLGVTNAAFLDGSVRGFTPRGDAQWRALMTINGNDPINLD